MLGFHPLYRVQSRPNQGPAGSWGRRLGSFMSLEIERNKAMKSEKGINSVSRVNKNSHYVLWWWNDLHQRPTWRHGTVSHAGDSKQSYLRAKHLSKHTKAISARYWTVHWNLNKRIPRVPRMKVNWGENLSWTRTIQGNEKTLKIF